MPRFRKIGVLGGMGVQATIELIKRVYAATAAEEEQGHVPMLVDMNPQVPSRIRHLIERTGPDPGPTLAGMAQRLEQAGAEVLAMPCNTAHLYAPEILRGLGIGLLNMPQRACAEVARGMTQGGTVGILASPATRGTGLFARFLVDFEIETDYPPNETDILASIRRIKTSGATSDDTALLEREATLAKFHSCIYAATLGDGLLK